MNMEPMKMDVVLLLLLTASGLCVVSARVERQYHFVNEPMNWTEAQKYCREKFTDLATIDSMEDVNFLFNVEEFYRFISKYPRILVWIGLHDDLDSWMWSLSDTSFYKHAETEFRRWKPGEPKRVSHRKHCTMMSDGSWYDSKCGANAKAVCMDVRGLNVTFVLIDYYMNWTEAQNYCRKHHTDLASVRNMTENQRVKELVPTGQHAWIGLSRDAWRWSDGSSYSFTYWQPAEPDNKNGDEFCVAIKPVNSLRWSDWSCDRKLTFLCYSQVTKKQVIKVRLQRKDSSLDLNDPAVLEQMLKQLQQKLKDQGLKDDVKLSWRKQAGGKVFHREKETKQRKTRATEDEL